MCAESSSLPPPTMIVLGKRICIHMAAAEQVNELVRDDAQPLKPLGPGMVHEDPAASDLDPERRVRVPGRHHREERFRQPDVLVDWRRGLLRPVLLPREYDEDFAV